MKKMFFALLALLASPSFSTNSGSFSINQVRIHQGCGSFSGKTIVVLSTSARDYFVTSDNPAFESIKQAIFQTYQSQPTNSMIMYMSSPTNLSADFEGSCYSTYPAYQISSYYYIR